MNSTVNINISTSVISTIVDNEKKTVDQERQKKKVKGMKVEKWIIRKENISVALKKQTRGYVKKEIRKMCEIKKERMIDSRRRRLQRRKRKER